MSKQSRHTWIYRAVTCHITTLLYYYIVSRAPLARHPGPLCKIIVVVRDLANIHFFDLCIHHVIHQNLMFCSTSHVLFPFSLSCRYIILSLFLQTPHKTLKHNHSKTHEITIKIDPTGPQRSPPQIMFSASFFIKVRRCNIEFI